MIRVIAMLAMLLIFLGLGLFVARSGMSTARAAATLRSCREQGKPLLACRPYATAPAARGKVQR